MSCVLSNVVVKMKTKCQLMHFPTKSVMHKRREEEEERAVTIPLGISNHVHYYYLDGN